jgi:hypothetical protein
MVKPKSLLLALGTLCLLASPATAQTSQTGSVDDPRLQQAWALIEKLTSQVAAQEARLRKLEEERSASGLAKAPASPVFIPAGFAAPTASPATAAVNDPAPAAPTPAAPVEPVVQPERGASLGADLHEHTIELPGGGPALKIRGYFDMNLGLGTNSNTLVFPVPKAGRSTFQAGEFDLFFSSKLNEKLSFVGELVIGSNPSNAWGTDLERLQLTYRVNPYFEVSGGRYHTAIGYYNTAFHHGTWFQTAEGRPFMYFFEDAGGLLPIHGVGVTTTGLVPGMESLGLHWIAEISNGRPADPNAESVQNFQAEKTSKALNFAAYIKPRWAPGWQIGGSYYIDRLYPPASGAPRVDQRIASVYAVLNKSAWEFLAEGVLLTNRLAATGQSYNSPLSYVQVSHQFRAYRPYVRYQYVNSIAGDPVNQFQGRYAGPSVGLRWDVYTYSAFKLQYNLLRQPLLPAASGLTAQMAFTF